jgi:hypothetical protein
MGRKPTKSGPLVSISVDGRGAAWCDGQFSGDCEILAFARRAADIGMECHLYGQNIVADNETPLGAAAALMGYSPGRSLLVEAPNDVRQTIAAGMSWDDPTKWNGGPNV